MPNQPTRRHRIWPSSMLLAIAVLAPASLTGEESGFADGKELRQRATSIRASADKLSKVQQIPWVTDLFEGFRLAKEEKRPVFLYLITGDPLGDC